MILPLNLGERSYDIVLESGALNRVGELLDLNRRALILTDSGVPAIYAQTVAKAAKSPVILTIPEGEASKQFPVYQDALSAMLENGFSRHDCVVAVGGGVCGDLAGFAAATYMRGIDFYNIPTTVLSQVDSSIGGKTAIDFGGFKNIIGAFWQPKKVVIDPDVLKTLPLRQRNNGLAEAVKMSLTSDAELFRIFEEENIDENLTTIIERSLRIKKAVVEQDEKESGLRKILNFGHTLGHAIESSASPELYHGECVALGMLPMCSDEVRAQLIPVLGKIGLPTTISIPTDKIREAMGHDKKSSASGIDAVLVDEPGSFRIVNLSVDELVERYESIFPGGRA